jgi:hypothetical protein
MYIIFLECRERALGERGEHSPLPALPEIQYISVVLFFYTLSRLKMFPMFPKFIFKERHGTSSPLPGVWGRWGTVFCTFPTFPTRHVAPRTHLGATTSFPGHSVSTRDAP